MHLRPIFRVGLICLSLGFLPSLSLPAVSQAGMPTVSQPATASPWIRPTGSNDPLIWGRRDGIIFGIPSKGGMRGPRGLIRVGILSAKTGEPQLLNFIAIEPVTTGIGDRFDRMAFSELEFSQLDPGVRGKRLWIDSGSPDGSDRSDPAPGVLETLTAGHKKIERLSVRIDVERFSANGAHVYLVASIDSDHPNELRLTTHHFDDSSPIEELAVTATMGNFERLRLLYLKDHIVFSGNLYRDYKGSDFVEHYNYPLDEMLRGPDGDAIVLCTTDEASPATTPAHWPYPLPPLTQYWRVPAADIEPDLRVRVNGRRLYWQSQEPLPGGVAFENFEVRQRYRSGQTFIFGITPKTPQEITPAIPHLERSLLLITYYKFRSGLRTSAHLRIIFWGIAFLLLCSLTAGVLVVRKRSSRGLPQPSRHP